MPMLKQKNTNENASSHGFLCVNLSGPATYELACDQHAPPAPAARDYAQAQLRAVVHPERHGVEQGQGKPLYRLLG